MAKTDPVPNRLFWQARRRVNLTRGQLADEANKEPVMKACEHELMTENFIGRIEQGRIGGNMCAQRLAALCARLGVAEPSDIGLIAGRRYPTDSAPARPRTRVDATDTADEKYIAEQQPAAPQISEGRAGDRSAGDELAPRASDTNPLASGLVQTWTGVEAAALRAAQRMSIRAYAEHLGVATASVSNWERRGNSVQLRTETQQILDTDLQRATEPVRARFFAAIDNRPETDSAGSRVVPVDLENYSDPESGLEVVATRQGYSVAVAQTVRLAQPIASGPEGIAKAWAALGAQLASFRKAAGYSQISFAPLALVSRSTVANVETGRQRVDRNFWTTCDSLLNTNGSLASDYDRISREVTARQAEKSAKRIEPHLSKSYVHLKADGSEEATTNRRDALTMPLIAALAASTSKEISRADLDPLTVAEIEDDIEQITTDYATTTHDEMFALVKSRWTQVDEALARRSSLPARRRMTRTAGQLSYFLGRLAFNCGDFNAARQVCVLAEQYAGQVDDRVILASVAGLRSSIAYYRGRYEDAISVFNEYPSDPSYLSARNAAYRARAYARLGNEEKAEAELELMWRSAKESAPVPGDLPLGHAAASMFAGWTLAYLGQGERAEIFARDSISEYVRSGSRASKEEWAHALLMLSYSLANRRRPIVDEAATVATSAVDLIGSYPTHTAMRRAEDFASSMRKHDNSPSVRILRDRLQGVARPALTGTQR